jgi:hypothetical protein
METFAIYYWDIYDGWTVLSTDPLTRPEADAQWSTYTGGGTHESSELDGNYYAIFSMTSLTQVFP